MPFAKANLIIYVVGGLMIALVLIEFLAQRQLMRVMFGHGG